ncbi:MAG: molybdopterin-dependent oxidoreductase [Armatimonadetes bacterium]|nr:molybdopterin-dependent oxidoreductase [Armatimonadota bacterium]
MNRTLVGLGSGGLGGAAVVMLMLRGAFTGGIPVVALALWERALRLIPMEVFGFLIVRLKFAARPLAFWGMLGGLVLAWGLLGALLARTPWMRRTAGARTVLSAAATLLAAFALTFIPLVGLTHAPAAAALGSRLEAAGVTLSDAALVQQILGALAAYAAIFAVIFTALALAGATRRSAVAPPAGETVTRREALRRSLAFVVGALAGSALAGWVSASGRRGLAWAQSIFNRIKGLPPEVTPNKDFYVVSKNPPGFDPVVKGAKWKLEITGLVGRPVTFTYDQIRALPAVKQWQTLECISNEVGGNLISNAIWRGVRLRDLLQRAGGVKPTAVKIAFRCADGYTESLPVIDALQQDTLLVWEMNGEPLPPAHGFPVRLLVPGLFGMKNPKWITRIEAVDYDFQGYWERSGWSDEAVVKTMSKFTTPTGRHMAPTAGEEVDLGGAAYGGDRGIKGVEVSTDDGKTWMPAQVKPPLGSYTWVLWAALWKPTAAGEYTLKVRARDGVGVLQTARATDTLPDGASGYHFIRLRVKK